MVYRSIEQLIGNTPLLELCGTERELGLSARIFAKLEYFNPAGSVKDRVALAMIDDMERRGIISKGAVIIEPTSGNTGIGLAMVGAARGYRVIIVMPDTMSVERRRMIAAYGAEIELSDGAKGMAGAIARANELHDKLPGSVIAGQFINPSNTAAHRAATGPELWNALDGRIDIFVAAVGTGGTLTGVGEYLKSKAPGIRIVAVEPSASAVLSGGKAGAHKIQGIGAGFVPEILDTKLYDEVVAVSDGDAYAAAKAIGRREGVLVGISAGAAYFAAVQLAKRPENAGKNIAVIFPDGGDRYFSTELFD